MPIIGFGDWLGWQFASSWLDRFFVSRAAAIHVPSDLSRVQIIDRYARDAKVVPLGVDAGFYGAGDAKSVIEENGLQGKFVMLAVGKLHPQENHVSCLMALKKLLPVIPNALLMIVGDGPMRSALEDLAESLQLDGHVKFTGHIPSWKVRDYYKACAVHLFPPLQESWGMAPFEALAAQRVSIVSNECGAAGVISERGIGITCPPTAEDFAKTILGVYSHSFPLSEMALAGMEFVRTRLTWQAHSDEVLRLMEERSRMRDWSAPRRTERGVHWS
jgi:glycosyltransferase involved in cell wall biosynthesis